MKTKSPYLMAVACLLAFVLAIPFDGLALPDAGTQRAGEISRVIPSVSITRGAKTITANAKTSVDWQDVISTQASGRARVSLEDGSVLNVGSDSSVRVAKHDAGAQQTDLEVSLGKLRSQAQKISQPNGKFEVKTPAGVAGVVGTDFYVSYENNVMTVIVFEGIVKVCNLAGVCVELKAGQMTTVRNGDSSGPAPPNQAALSTLSGAVADTNPDSGPGVGQVHHISKGTAITLGILAIVPIIVIPIVTSHGSSTPAPYKCPPSQCG